MPLATLMIAGALFGWYRWTAPQRIEEIRLAVASLLTEAAPPSPARGAIDGTDPAIAPDVRNALARVRADAELRAMAIGVAVHPGDVPGGDIGATHHAVVAIGGEPRVILRYRHHGRSGMSIVGVQMIGDSPP